uniref:Uncharacterized protein n=1 Tax=Panagrolaimus sp. ES5 TaxID=591445 RepID=A0AC34FI34_9BILA
MDQIFLNGYQQGFQDALKLIRDAYPLLEISTTPIPLSIPDNVLAEIYSKNYCTPLKEMIIQLLKFPNLVPSKPKDQLERLKKWDASRYEVKKSKNCYLLLDARIIGNNYCSFWTFVLAIIYIGMGEHDRMLDHVDGTMLSIMANEPL